MAIRRDLLADIKEDSEAVAIFAYGQTGSGKTHTMFGSDHEGIIPQALRYLFDTLQTRAPGATATLEFFEIFNERVIDLLNPEPMQNLPVRFNRNRRVFFVEGAETVQIRSIEEVLHVMHIGLQHRAIAAHELNERSSRSHAMLTLHIYDPRNEAAPPGKLTFVDLAGNRPCLAWGDCDRQKLGC